jgi:hypothetical protein
LRTPSCLRERKHRQQEQWCADVENQIAPAAENPEAPFRRGRRNAWDSLGTRECAGVLHGADAIFLQSDRKINHGIAAMPDR